MALPPAAPEAAGAARDMRSYLARWQAWSWLGLAVLYVVFDAGRNPDADDVELGMRTVVWACLGLMLTTGLAFPMSRVRSGWAQVGVALAGAVLGGFVWLLLFHALDGWLEIEGGWVELAHWDREHIVAEWLDFALVLLVWHGGLLASLQSRRAASARAQSAQLRSLATEMRLRTLEARLRPHFLFNAINAAMALIPDEPDRAEHVLQRLADLLRGSLLARGPSVTIAEEAELVRAYIDIERIRFDDNIDVRVEIDPAVEGVSMPVGALLSLVDNAFKHGAPQVAGGPLVVRILARAEGRLVAISVHNSGELGPRAPHSLGIGLANIREQLAARFGDRAGLELTGEAGVRAHLWFPVDPAA